MTILSRAWYAILSLAVAGALAALYLGVGEHNRQVVRGVHDALMADSDAIRWRLEDDARRRLDALLPGSSDGTLEQALAGANALKDVRPPVKWRLLARKALAAISESVPADARTDALFAVDRDGYVLAEVGYDAVAGNEDFELGGFPAVDDALRGWARDDVWIFGNKMYLVVARPTQTEPGQAPAGALVGLKEVTLQFAEDLAKRTGTNVVFYASGEGMAGGAGAEGFERDRLKAVGADLKNVSDQTYGEKDRSDVRTPADDLGAVYVRLRGDVWTLGGGFAVVRAKVVEGGVAAILAHADEHDRAGVPWIWLVLLVLAGTGIGVLVTRLETIMPLLELTRQSERIKGGAIDRLEGARLGGLYARLAKDLNDCLQQAAARVAAASKDGRGAKPQMQLPRLSPSAASGGAAQSSPKAARSSRPDEAGDLPTTTMSSKIGAPSSPENVPAAGAAPKEGNASATMHAVAQPHLLALSAVEVRRPGDSEGPRSEVKAISVNPPALRVPDTTAVRSAPAEVLSLATRGNKLADTTAVVAAPAELLAEVTDQGRLDEAAEWRATYAEFIRVRKQCGEPTDTLTFETFSAVLKKHRDALMANTKCKRVRFAVDVKDGKAALKATPSQS